MDALQLIAQGQVNDQQISVQLIANHPNQMEVEIDY